MPLDLLSQLLYRSFMRWRSSEVRRWCGVNVEMAGTTRLASVDQMWIICGWGMGFRKEYGIFVSEQRYLL